MDYAQIAYDHIRHFSEEIGGRGSCSEEYKRAAEYARNALKSAGVENAGFEPFNGNASTYLPFTLAFACALTGTIFSLIYETHIPLAIGALFNFLGAWAMFAETDFTKSWAGLFVPLKPTVNVSGVIPAGENKKGNVVLCSHLDTHRTPIFYSSDAWQKMFGVSVTGAFLSMAVSTITLILAIAFSWNELRWLGLFFGCVQLYALTLVASAPFTPFSPGANDNASGTGVILALAKRLEAQPLKNIAVNFLFTDCEETGAHGINSYLNQHAGQFGGDTVFIILDEVGAGQIKTLSDDGLIRRYKTHPEALRLAQNANAGLSNPAVILKGTAYTDALPATKRGFVSITVSSTFPNPETAVSHWHQMSDRLEFIDKQTLQDALTFTWNILQDLDSH